MDALRRCWWMVTCLAATGCALDHPLLGAPSDGSPDEVILDAGFDQGLDQGVDTGRDQGVDTPTCRPPSLLCGGVCVPTDDLHHCGRCGNDCTLIHNTDPARASCVGGMCRYVCQPRWGDCTGPTDGCETDLAQVEHCGTCETRCGGATPFCAMVSGVMRWQCVSGCVSPMVSCASGCVDLSTDLANCGMCTRACPVPAGGMATCREGLCGQACPTDAHLCGGACAANTATDSCGTRCTPCPEPMANGSAACDGTACSIVCESGFHLCSGQCVSNGSTASCGTRCTPCPEPANAFATCSDGTCDFECDGGFTRSGSMCVGSVVTPCGNTTLDMGESCDDGNMLPGDGCSASCTLEATAAEACPGTSLRLGVGTAIYTGSTIATLSDFECGGMSHVGRTAGDRAYLVTPTASGRLTITVRPSSVFDVVIEVRTMCTSEMSELRCTDNNGAGTSETTWLPVTAGTAYAVIVDGYAGSIGTYTMRLTLSTP